MLATQTAQDQDLSRLDSTRTEMPSASVRLGVICDLVEENWLSMDLVGDMLLAHLQNDATAGIKAERIRPSMLRRFTTSAGANSRLAFNTDRLLNRFWDYPRFLRRYREEFDLFHLVDHSYAQLLFELPAGRTVVTCHDTDTFQCLMEPQAKRSAFFRAMVSRTLCGLRKAAVIVCPSVATRDKLLAHDLIPKERLRVVPLGSHPSCSPQPNQSADFEAAQFLGLATGDAVDLLHVGTTVERKRIDILLRVFAQVKRRFSTARLIHVGASFTPAQWSMIDELRLTDSVLELPYLERPILAAVYRRVAAVLLPSEREGFGLPVLEAMACGTPVIASDLPALREVGGDCTVYCPVAAIEWWADAVSELLLERQNHPDQWHIRKNRVLAQAGGFTWAQFTRRMAAIYREVLPGSYQCGEAAS